MVVNGNFGNGAGFPPPTGMDKKTDKTIDIAVIIKTIGIITLIKLAVKPNFLPDSSDMLALAKYFGAIAE